MKSHIFLLNLIGFSSNLSQASNINLFFISFCECIKVSKHIKQLSIVSIDVPTRIYGVNENWNRHRFIPALNLRFFATYSELREEIHTDGLISRDRQVARLLADLRRIFGLHSAFA
jgi:hypothetical protein